MKRNVLTIYGPFKFERLKDPASFYLLPSFSYQFYIGAITFHWGRLILQFTWKGFGNTNPTSHR